MSISDKSQCVWLPSSVFVMKPWSVVETKNAMMMMVVVVLAISCSTMITKETAESLMHWRALTLNRSSNCRCCHHSDWLRMKCAEKWSRKAAIAREGEGDRKDKEQRRTVVVRRCYRWVQTEDKRRKDTHQATSNECVHSSRTHTDAPTNLHELRLLLRCSPNSPEIRVGYCP